MDRTVFVILLLTGFCVLSTSFPNVYYFISQKMTWDDALAYCSLEHTSMAQIVNKENVTAMMNTPPGGYTGKAWIGLFENMSEWTWVDGQPATYFNWGFGQPDDVNIDEICVAMDPEGNWSVVSCSEDKRYVCHGGDNYFVGPKRMTWNDARIQCESKEDVLVTISNTSINSEVQGLLTDVNGDDSDSRAWIGLNRSKSWDWSGPSEPGEEYTFTNWQNGQPDNVNGENSCVAVALTDGTWTDEPCNATYPFFCYGIYKAQKTVVRMKIETSANMEDPACNAEMLRQLRATLTNQGVTDFKLTWKKLPEKQTQENSDIKDPC
ncbi:macrophage mannose receptor 1-like isoform X1 [Sebastes fasciatus]|uniref:macrophage mannose receptor 1-like isoform X1 n=1 Tax=Sebastes fasciatus TaxID=394691 RepID=UPI003D9F0E1B